MSGTVISILIADNKGEELREVPSASLEEGKGIVGDRYHKGTGQFSEKLQLKNNHDFHLTMIESEEIDAFKKHTQLNLKPSQFRRNLVCQGIRLNDLVGKEFFVGDVKVKGIRLCEPCSYLAGLHGPKVMEMMGKAGLRVQVLSSGNIAKNCRVTQ